ncbi:MAG: hypothetical protein Q9164_003063 [Protoblastenia rupestris]
MASPSHRRTQDPLRPPKARTRHTTEREERKERGTPEKPHSRTPKRRTHSPERSPRRERTPQKKTGSPERRRRHRSPDRRSKRETDSEKHTSYESTTSGTNLLSSDALAQLDALNEKTEGQVRNVQKKEKVYSVKRGVKEKVVTGRVAKEKIKHRRRSDGRNERRRISGPLAEEGKAYGGKRGGYISADERKGKKRFGKRFWISIAVIAVLLAIFIPVGVVVAGKKSDSGGGAGGATVDSSDPSNENLKEISESDVPPEAKNTVLDPFTWYDTKDFNVTFTNEAVGGLSVIGLESTWEDTAKANQFVPALDKEWKYGEMPIRGINLGGWLSIEPFITPSLFNQYKPNQGIVDEWTLTKQLGPSNAAETLEKHYAKFITEKDFEDIKNAGFDHVRIPYSYWAVTTYPGDPYVPKISWRYLLRGIEYARKYGLRVNLDLHGLPGSQNGWNHSGRQGSIGWLNGTDGPTNAQRSLDIHTQLSTFFAQERYKNIITIYGLANEPKMTHLKISDVVAWTTSAAQIVRKSGLKAKIAFGDGFLGLTKWQGQLQGIEGLVLDAHEYVIFDPNQIALDHRKKLEYACTGWTGQMSQSLNTATGFGPTLCGEWSQADTDCTPYLNNVGAGTRWEGTLQSTDRSVAVLTPTCPSKSSACSCEQANADPGDYSDQYKKWLLMNAQGQMTSFETAWGWFYWTWVTEGATQWDYKAGECLCVSVRKFVIWRADFSALRIGMANGILPKKTWDRDFNCTTDVSDFEGLSENY